MSQGSKQFDLGVKKVINGQGQNFIEGTNKNWPGVQKDKKGDIQTFSLEPPFLECENFPFWSVRSLQ